MPRLPGRFQTRSAYALAAFFGCFVSFVFFTLILGVFGAPISFGVVVSGSIFYGIFAAFAAALFWPKASIRTKRKMTLTGVITVVFTFALISFLFMLLVLVSAQEGDAIVESFELFGLVFLSGNVMTFGIPYIMAVLLSQLFVTEEQPKAKV